MASDSYKGISIGRDLWIPWVDIDGTQEGALSIEPVILPLELFWSALEVVCVAECCGIDAFSFWPEDIHKASAKCDREAIMRGLGVMRQAVEASEANIFVSERLNNYFDKQVLLHLIDHISIHVIDISL